MNPKNTIMRKKLPYSNRSFECGWRLHRKVQKLLVVDGPINFDCNEMIDVT